MNPIGYRLDTEDDEEECEQADNVGHGCASLTPVEEPGPSLRDVISAAIRLRKAGARKVKLGDLEVEFGADDKG